MEDLTELIRIAKEKDAIRKEANLLKTSRIISSENDITRIIKDFYKYLNENGDYFIGKKVFLTDGSKSAAFSKFVDTFENSIVLSDMVKSQLQYFSLSKKYRTTNVLNVSISIWGGSMEDDTTYTKYIDRTIFDVLAIAEDGKLLGFNTLPISLFYTDEDVAMAQTEISEIENQIKLLKDKISERKIRIPNGLK